MAQFGIWIRTADELPPQNRLVAVRVVIGYTARGAGIAGYTVARLVGDTWAYPMHKPPTEPPVEWTPLPDNTY